MTQGTVAERQYPTVTALKDAGTWRLLHTSTGESRGTSVQYDVRDRQALLNYAESVRREGPTAFENHADVPALVTFNHPIPAERFLEMVSLAGASVKSYRIRTIQSDGRRGTIGGAPELDGRILDPSHVARMVDNQHQKRDVTMTVAGVIDAEVVVNPRSYEALTRNRSEVFLVDTMRGVAARELAQRGILDIPMAAIGLTAPYWSMEDFGLTTP